MDASLDHALPFAAALEMIHTYSLIHDDLPAMDDDTLRRGRPTNHIRFDEATAILAGDALLTEAFALLSSPQWSMDARTRLSLISLLAQSSGAQGMVGGQLLDLLFEGQSCSLTQLETIHRLKTGALLRAAVVGGAMAAEASPDAIARLDRFGSLMGLAFQIADDVLDVTASSQELGKDAGSDLKNGKATYVSLLGLEGARAKAQSLLTQSLELIQPMGERARTLAALATYIVNRRH